MTTSSGTADALRDAIVMAACEFSLMTIASRYALFRTSDLQRYTDDLLAAGRRLELAVLAYEASHGASSTDNG